MLRSEQRRMAKFALVGIFNTGVDFAVFVALVYGVGASSIWAQVASYSAGVANSYWWNRRWTFRLTGRASWAEAGRFAAINGLSFAAATAMLLGLQHGFGWAAALAKAVSVVVSMAVNYAGSKYWVFRMESRENRAG